MRRFLAACTVLFVILTVPAAADHFYPCHQAPVAPVIDGRVDGDPAWEGAPAVTGFFALGGGYTHAKQTVARVLYDAEALYFSVVAEEPDAAELNPQVSDGGWTWEEDSLEFFVQPADTTSVYQFGVTAGGAKGAGAGDPDISLATAAAHIGEDYYSVELRIPWQVLHSAAPAPGDAWRFTVCRNIRTATSGGDRYTSWSPLETRFLEPNNFARLEFRGAPPPAAELRAQTEQLNSAYREVILRDLAKAAVSAGEYREALAEAAASTAYRESASELLTRWEHLGDLQARAQHISLLQVRQALTGMQELIAASYQLKWSHRLDRLVADN